MESDRATVKRRVISVIKDESGSVESALVMIPLITLFLITLQLIVTVNFRNIDLTTVQNRASAQATQQQVLNEDRLIKLNSYDFFDQLRLLIVNKKREIPQIFPWVSQILGGKQLNLSGVAVFEEPEQCKGGYWLC